MREERERESERGEGEGEGERRGRGRGSRRGRPWGLHIASVNSHLPKRPFPKNLENLKIIHRLQGREGGRGSITLPG